MLLKVSVYSRVSPGEGSVLKSASIKSASTLLAVRLGADVTGVTVGSSLVPVSGSSVGRSDSSLLARVPWLATWVVLAGKGLFTRASKVMVTEAAAARVPKSMATAVSPAVLPVVTVP